MTVSYQNISKIKGSKALGRISHCLRFSHPLLLSTDVRNRKTYENEEWIMQAMEAQGFARNIAGEFERSESGQLKMEIPADLIPKCPDDGSEMTMNLRSDDKFVEDEGWHKASAAYLDFLKKHEGQHVLFLEIGVGSNTPVIIK